MVLYEFWSPRRTNRRTHILCKHTTASHQETGGRLTPHTLPFLLHGPNAFETPSNGVITPRPPGDKEPLLGSNTTAFTSRPHRESLATTWASPGHLGQAHSRGREPWGDSRGWGAKGSAGTSEVLRPASQLELKAALCLVCPSIRPSSPGAAELRPTANTGRQCSRETEAVFKSLRDESVLLI